MVTRLLNALAVLMKPPGGGTVAGIGWHQKYGYNLQPELRRSLGMEADPE
jgi:hypothetical protein